MTDKERELEIENRKLKEIHACGDNKHLGLEINGVYFSDEQIATLNIIDSIREYEQNKKAVEALEKLKDKIMEDVKFKDKLKEKGHLTEYGEGGAVRNEVIIYHIDQLIKELGGKDEQRR